METEAYLSYLATERHVSASTQNQAISALLFLYRHVLRREVGDLNAVRASCAQRIPTVLTQDEARRVLAALHTGHETSGVYWIMASLMYGTGMRRQPTNAAS